MSAEDTIRDGGGQRLERLSVGQAARALGLTESGVRKRVSMGHFAARKGQQRDGMGVRGPP